MEAVPQFLVDKLNSQYGNELTNNIINGYQKKFLTFRINRLKANVEEIEEILKREGFLYKRVAWYEDAFIVENSSEENIRALSIYQEGKVYLQSLSSMLPVLFLGLKEGESVLDMAAAPGGKTTQMASITQNKILITACEKNRIRSDRLKYNIEKQGVRKITILNCDAKDLDDYFSFDKILLDAPCSGSGTLQLENAIEKYFRVELIEKTKKIQNVLLQKASVILKPGAEMIYSTCSILEEENERQVEQILQTGKLEIVPIDVSLLKDVPLLPSKIEGTVVVAPTTLYEGFFICKLRKL